MLAEYCGNAAVFFGDAPDDNQAGWPHGQSMPRVSFTYDTLADKERKSAGSLYVSIYCANNTSGQTALPEDIAPLVIKLLKDVIFSPDDFGVFYCAWNRTEQFSLKETKSTSAAYTNNLVVGCDITFDILEYPKQISTDPDPVMALNQYIADAVPEAVILHHHEIDDFIETSSRNPVVYVRNAGYRLDRQTNTVCWMKGTLHVHLLCPDSSVRMQIITALANQMALAGEVTMLDGSPMFVNAIEGDNSADYMTAGQMKLETMYGILRTVGVGPVLEGIRISEERGQ